MKVFILLILFVCFCNACNSQSQREKYKKTKNILLKVYAQDQKFRVGDYLNHWKEQDSLDIENTKIVTKIIDSMGWLGTEVIGDTANDALFLVIQHSTQATMEKYLPIMRKAAAENKAKKQNLALLIDRVEILNNRKQIFGSQVNQKDGKIVLYNMVEPEKVNERRKEMGLENIEDYLKRFDN